MFNIRVNATGIIYVPQEGPVVKGGEKANQLFSPSGNVNKQRNGPDVRHQVRVKTGDGSMDGAKRGRRVGRADRHITKEK